MNAANRPVVVAAGGTGGHIYPAMAVAGELGKHAVPVVWIGTQQGLEARIVPAAGIDIRWITISGLRGKGIVGMLGAPFKLLLAMVQSVRILRDVRAAAVLGMGGFVSGPVGIAALLVRRPLVLHEQNAKAGMTNRYLSRFAAQVFSAMPGVFSSSIKAQTVGNPVRDDIVDIGAAEKASTTGRKLHVLVVGGSRGARALNNIVPAAIALLHAQQFAAGGMDIRHQTGTADVDTAGKAYASSRDNGFDISVDAYIEDMAAAYQWADVVICRAGAMTVSELSAAGLPSILVPFPFAVDDHQTLNARYLADANAAVIIQQRDLDAQVLADQLLAFDGNREQLASMAVAARAQYRPDAAVHVANALMETTR